MKYFKKKILTSRPLFVYQNNDSIFAYKLYRQIIKTMYTKVHFFKRKKQSFALIAH